LPSATKLLTGTGIPPQLAALPPFNTLPNAGKPLADADVLTPAEQQAIGARITAINAAIKDVASARNIPVADVSGLFTRLATNKVSVAGVPITTAYITGGAFGLDGNHLTDLGYTLLANEFIKATNSAYGTHIPLAPTSRFLQNNDQATADALSGNNLTAIPTFSAEAVKVLNLWNTMPGQKHFRSRHDDDGGLIGSGTFTGPGQTVGSGGKQ
ncbi:MAG TPA: hypothetical protein VII75_09985, partial [Thermoanaerobaculia bacterium]